MTRLAPAHRIGRTVVLVALAAFATGCVLDGPTDNPRIVNESGMDVEILLVSPGYADKLFVSVSAGQSHEVIQYSGSCLPYDLVAKTTTGEVVSQTTQPLCPGDRWVIEPPP